MNRLLVRWTIDFIVIAFSRPSRFYELFDRGYRLISASSLKHPFQLIDDPMVIFHPGD